MLSRIIILLLWSTLIIACRKFVWDNPNDGINQDKEPASLKDGLLAYYPFNANANDESGNGNNGSVNGATLVTDRFNKINSAYTFDGIDDWIAINGSSSFNSQNILSIINFLFAALRRLLLGPLGLMLQAILVFTKIRVAVSSLIIHFRKEANNPSGIIT
jgi:hypothetical protein